MWYEICLRPVSPPGQMPFWFRKRFRGYRTKPDTFALLGRVGTRSSAFALAYNAEIRCRRTACMTWQIFLWIGGTRHRSARFWRVGSDAQWGQDFNHTTKKQRKTAARWSLMSHFWRKLLCSPCRGRVRAAKSMGRLAPRFSKMIVWGNWEGIVSNESETEWISW